MNTLFPFGFPGPTAFYLVLYIVTLVIHVVFMNYVMAGAGYLFFHLIRNRVRPGSIAVEKGSDKPVAVILREWLTFVLSAAITAGVAPLLFVQILYKQHFYTANLLLSHRWMAVVPALILGFYLLYVLKTRRAKQWGNITLGFISGAAFLCFAFTAFSWTENHLLSQQSARYWGEFYASDRWFYVDRELMPRLLMWTLGAIPTMAMMVGWQLWWHQKRGNAEADVQVRHLSFLALAGLGVTVVSGAFYFSSLNPELNSLIYGPFAGPYLGAAACGGLLQVAAWSVQWFRRKLSCGYLLLAASGVFLSITGMAVVREAIRLGSIPIENYYAQHQQASQVGGLWVFVIFTLLNLGIATFCILIARSPQFRVVRSKMLGTGK
jgi:hypothetical protein